MRIIVKSKERPNIRFLLPSCLILNRFCAGWAAKGMERNGMPITKAQAVKLIRELNRYRKQHQDWVLVEVIASDGTYVKVKL